ncbi:hypothetical protein BJV74DRAFT_885774 [Russula compacta]|nr:hypothetical protein BJV74DRAFT_885774 [Russula compacta]
MSLAALVNGADCGLANPLQGLTKNLDTECGVQQDHFGANRAGFSQGTFRTTQAVPSAFGEGAAHFFSTSQSASPAPPLAQPPFDLRLSLPAPSFNSAGMFSSSSSFTNQAPTSSRATTFLTHTSKPSVVESLQPATPPQHQGYSAREQMYPSFSHVPATHARRIAYTHFCTRPQTTTPNLYSCSQIDDKQLQNVFQFHEQAQTSEIEVQTEPALQPPEADLLARTAESLVHSFEIAKPLSKGMISTEQAALTESEEDANDAFFRQDNDVITTIGERIMRLAHPELPQVRNGNSCNAIGRSLKRGLSVLGYSPNMSSSKETHIYLENDYTTTSCMGGQCTHSLSERWRRLSNEIQHTRERGMGSVSSSKRTSANSRLSKRLQRALELDPTHLPSWLALAVSYTNEGDRHGTYEAVQNWVRHNDASRDFVAAYEANYGAESNGANEFQKPVGCLISMAMGVPQPKSTEVDADVQIALAVLLNTNEILKRALGRPLSIRPGDWLLYSRVGATLANGGRANVALSYYHRALEINKVQGISYINLKRYEEAAQHISDALVLQDSDVLEVK